MCGESQGAAFVTSGDQLEEKVRSAVPFYSPRRKPESFCGECQRIVLTHDGSKRQRESIKPDLSLQQLIRLGPQRSRIPWSTPTGPCQPTPARPNDCEHSSVATVQTTRGPFRWSWRSSSVSRQLTNIVVSGSGRFSGTARSSSDIVNAAVFQARVLLGAWASSFEWSLF